MADFFKTTDVPQEVVDRESTRRAVMSAVSIYLDIAFGTPGPLDLKRLWEEAGNTAIGEMSRYRSKHRPTTRP